MMAQDAEKVRLEREAEKVRLEKKAQEEDKKLGLFDEEENFLREGKSRIINMEFSSLTTFAVNSNFLTPDAIIQLL